MGNPENDGIWVTPEEAERLRAMAQIRRREAERERQFRAPRPAPSPVRKAPQPPAYQPSRQSVRPTNAPTSPNPAPRVSQRRTSEGLQLQEEAILQRKPALDKPVVQPEKRKSFARRYPRTVATILAVAGVGGFMVYRSQGDKLPNISIANFGEQFAQGDSNNQGYATSTLEAPAIETLGAEALTLENCQAEGAAVASIRFSAELPLEYQLTAPDNQTTTTPNPYLVDRTGSFTESGYPEARMENFTIKLYACEDTESEISAVEQSGDEYTVNLGAINIVPKYDERVEFISTDFSPTARTKLADNTSEVPRVIWPATPMIASNPDEFTDESVQAINGFHAPFVEGVMTDQTRAILSTIVYGVLKDLNNASETASINQLSTFSNDAHNLAEVVSAGLAERIAGTTDITRAGAIDDFGSETYASSIPAKLRFSDDRSENVHITSTDIVVGDISTVEPKPTPTSVPTPSTTTQPGSEG